MAIRRAQSHARLNEVMTEIFQQWRQATPEMRARLRMAVTNRDFTGDDYEMLQALDDGSERHGASDEEINRLPLQVMTQAEIEAAAEAEMHRTCSVCLAPYEAGDQVRTVLCMHKVRTWRIDTMNPYCIVHILILVLRNSLYATVGI